MAAHRNSWSLPSVPAAFRQDHQHPDSCHQRSGERAGQAPRRGVTKLRLSRAIDNGRDPKLGVGRPLASRQRGYESAAAACARLGCVAQERARTVTDGGDLLQPSASLVRIYVSRIDRRGADGVKRTSAFPACSDELRTACRTPVASGRQTQGNFRGCPALATTLEHD
jgi:hypothetical protein